MKKALKEQNIINSGSFLSLCMYTTNGECAPANFTHLAIQIQRRARASPL